MARFPPRRLFFARSDFRLLKLNIFLISSSRELTRQKKSLSGKRVYAIQNPPDLHERFV